MFMLSLVKTNNSISYHKNKFAVCVFASIEKNFKPTDVNSVRTYTIK